MSEVLSVKNMSKAYPGVTALRDVSFSLRRGEIRALCGENGAGKSTLVKILMGIVQPDSGSVAINGESETIRGPQQAQSLGLGLVARTARVWRFGSFPTSSTSYSTGPRLLFDRPSTSITAVTASLVPDVLNYSWRDYGVRVGIWRMMEVMEKYGVKGTVALNSDVCRHYPRIIEGGKQLGWEWMGHGNNNSTLINRQTEEEERQLIKHVVTTIKESTGKQPRGWLSPALSESHRTLDILAENGVQYVANWVNDEQPYPMRVKTGSMLSMPYSIELNDIPVFLDQGQSAEAFGKMIRDQFDVLYEDGAKTGRVMSICLHPFLIGHPNRSKHFAEALAYITSRQEVWVATGGEIADWYNKNYLNT